MKKIFTALLALFFIIGLASYNPAYAETKIRALLNGKEIIFDQAPVIENGTTLVPVRAILEALGLELQYDAKTKAILAKNSEIEIAMQINNKNAYIDRVQVQMEVPAKIINSRTMVPIRFLAEAMELEVSWDGKSKIIYINEKREVLSETQDSTENPSNPVTEAQIKTNKELESWLVGLGAIYNFRYGYYLNTFELDDATRKGFAADTRDFLLEDWGIESKKDLMELIDWFESEGENLLFKELGAVFSAMPAEELQEFYETFDPEESEFFKYFLELYNKNGEKGILAWDYCQAGLLIVYGYEAGYLTKAEVYECSKALSLKVKSSFKNWDEVCQNYLEGYCFWIGDLPNAENLEYQSRLQAYNLIKNKTDIFDNSLFK